MVSKLKEQICLIVITDGRKGVLEKTLGTFRVMAEFVPKRMIVLDDSGDPEYGAYVDQLVAQFGNPIVRHHKNRTGFCATVADAWSLLSAQDGIEFVFHLEDDFEFIEPVPLSAMARELRRDRRLAQIALVRQPWNEREKEAGGLLELYRPLNIVEGEGIRIAKHKACFTTNPSLYPALVTRLGWPDGPRCEGIFTHKLINLGWEFAYLIPTGDHAVTHIGDQRIGTGY